jgi:hypothetical protein
VDISIVIDSYIHYLLVSPNPNTLSSDKVLLVANNFESCDLEKRFYYVKKGEKGPLSYEDLSSGVIISC